jgi:hypothetical protein
MNGTMPLPRYQMAALLARGIVGDGTVFASLSPRRERGLSKNFEKHDRDL